MRRATSRSSAATTSDHLVGLSHRAGRDRGLPDPPSGGRAGGCVGKPDPIRTEIVKAFIVLKRGEIASDSWPRKSRST